MKKSLVWIVLLGIVFSFNSCKDDPDPVSPIVGTWSLSKYKLTELPANFTDFEGFETVQIIGIEVGYTFVFNQDGNYTRAFNVGGNNQSLNDKGTYVYEGALLKVSPDDADDLDLIELYETPGVEFTVVGDVTEIRMTLSRTVTVFLLPDDWDPEVEPTNADFQPVDVVMQYIFNKL